MNRPKKHIVEAYSLSDRDYIPIAELSCLDPAQGVYAPVKVEYDLDAVSRIEGGDRELVLSSRIPASWDILSFDAWPGFLVDLLPQGHARVYWTTKLGLVDGSSSDWTIVGYSGKNPVGNLRIQNKATTYQKKSKLRSFSLMDVEKRSQQLLEYLEEIGEPVSSFTGAGGAAPKFFIAEGYDGTFFAQTDFDESQMKQQYLVKFPAGRNEVERSVLRAEAAYLTFAAKVLGSDQVAKGKRIGDALLTERFDRAKHQGWFERIAVESFYQRLNIPGHGKFLSLLDAAEDMAKTSKNPQKDLASFMKRDLVNLVLSNTDLHGRNYSYLRDRSGQLSLTPVYDLAPMAFSGEAIVRYARAGWRNEAFNFEESSGSIDWAGICAHLSRLHAGISSDKILNDLSVAKAVLLRLGLELDQSLRQEEVMMSMRKQIMDSFRQNLDAFGI